MVKVKTTKGKLTQNHIRWEKFQQELRDAADYVQFYTSIGCHPVGGQSADGWQKCKSHEFFGGEDRTASASFNVRTGYYNDFRASEKLSVYDLMVKIGMAVSWQHAQGQLADTFGVKQPNSMSKTSKLYKFRERQWDQQAAIDFCKTHEPITIEAMELCGARYGIYEGARCFSFPMYGSDFDVIGSLFIPISAYGFHDKAKTKAFRIHDKMEPGFIGTPAITYLAESDPDLTEEKATVYWTEGPSDMLAAYSKYPDGLFICNPYGCSETLKESRRKMLAVKKPRIICISDADKPGLIGGAKRVAELRKLECVEDAELYVVPYEIQDKNGKDVRDYLVEFDGMSFQSFLDGLKQEGVDVDKAEQEEQVQASSESKVKQASDKEILNKLDLQLIAVSESGGFTLQNVKTGRRTAFTMFTQFTYYTLLGMCGRRVQRYVEDCNEADLSYPDAMTFNELKLCVASLTSEIKNLTSDQRGDGLWMLGGESHDVASIKNLHMVKAGSFWSFEDGQFVQVMDAMVGDSVVDYKLSRDWVNVKRLNAEIKKAADVEYRTAAYEELFSYVDSWVWDNEYMSMMVCGLFYSAWLQACLPWRPTITLIGETDAGKTWLLTMLSEIYLETCQPYGKSTIAGIMQKIRFSSLPQMFDEFDQSKSQRALFSEFRGSSRGQISLKGTSNQDGREYALRHMPWLAGIFTSAESEADKNRLIELSIKKVDESTIRRPTRQDAFDLGYKILASVVATAPDILRNCEAILKAGNERGQRTRYRESYAVPYGALAAILGAPVNDIVDDMEVYIASIQRKLKDEDSYTDQESILEKIMSHVMVLGPQAPQYQATVAQVLFEPRLKAWQKELETMGVVRKVVKNKPYVVLNAGLMTAEKSVLGSRLDNITQGQVQQLMKRLPDSMREKTTTVHMAGKSRSSILLHEKAVQQWLHKERPEFLFDKHAVREEHGRELQRMKKEISHNL